MSSKSNWITKKFKDFDFLGKRIKFRKENQTASENRVRWDSHACNILNGVIFYFLIRQRLYWSKKPSS